MLYEWHHIIIFLGFLPFEIRIWYESDQPGPYAVTLSPRELLEENWKAPQSLGDMA